MILQIKRIILLLWIFFLPIQALFSQHTSRNNYTGAWETPGSWNPTWAVPQKNINPYDITINGYITVTGSLSFSGTSDLIINDTLVIIGDLSLADNSDLTINNNAILIVRGDLNVNKHVEIIANGYLIITGDIHKGGPNGEGSLTSNDNPVKVFIGGTIPSGLTDDNHKFPALNCTEHPTVPYPNSTCSYGNMTDLMNDPIYPFFQSTCGIPTPTITTGGPTTFCTGGSVSLTSSTGTSYLWSNGATTPGINITTAGSYTVQVINASGCQSAPSVATIVTVNALPVTPTITADGPTTFCAGATLNLTSSAGASYLWSNGATTPNINVTTAGSYTVRLTNASGCQSAVSAATVVNVNALPIVNAGTDSTIPNGTSTTIDATVSGMGPFTYNWSPSGQLVNSLTEDPTTLNLTTTTIFTLTATSITTSCSNTSTVTITISGGPLSSTPAASPGTICAGENIQLYAIASGGSGTYSYNWTSTPAGFTSSVAAPIVNPVISTTYNVTVFDGFTTVNSQVAVTVNAIPVPPTITADGPTTFCAGGSVTLTSSAGSTYLWSNGATTASINVTTGGSYTVRVKNAIGCQSTASVATVVTVNAFTVTPTITAGGPTTFCTGGSVTLTSSAETSYLWSNGATSQSINVTTAGSYTVQVTNASGCQSATSVATIVTVNVLPVIPTITADGPTTFCAGGSVTLTSSAGASYLWSNAGTTPEINITKSGSFTVQVTNTNGCQSAQSLATVVTVNDLPLVNITSSSSSMCISDQRTLTGSPSGGTFIISDGPGMIAGNVLSATATGKINLEYVYTNACTNKATQSIIVDENVIANAGADQELQFVFETQMEAELSPSGTSEWSLVSGAGNISDINSPTTRITELSLGENIFLWKVHNGSCEATDEVVIVVNDIVTPTVITPNEDGLNDALIFPGLSAFPGSTIIIYNRWGSEVYRSSDYKNDWNGKDHKKRDLQEDTYYYILKISNGRILKGFIEIIR